MWFKPSSKTVALLKNGNWLFLPVWVGIVAYLGLRHAGVVSNSWDKVFFSMVILWMIVYAVHTVSALASLHRDSKRSHHPDPDVAALVDKKIDIAEYRSRKEEHARSE